MARITFKLCTSGRALGEKECRAKLEVRMIRSASLGGVPIFRKSMPVLVCPKCDGPGNTVPPAQHTG